MKQRYTKLKSVALSALTTMCLALGAQATTISNVKYIDDKGVEQTCPEATVVAASSSRVTWNAGWYVVNNDVTLTKGADCTGDVKLILVDGAKLTADGSSDNNAGIGVTGDSNSFTVYGQSAGTGELKAITDQYGHGAGIGGGGSQEGNGGSGSNITINGGTVTAIGGLYGHGAGIGGGGSTEGNGGSGSNITINGGTVTAIGGEYNHGAGIGGGGSQAGNGGFGSNITINGGTVTATAGESSFSAGIGGGGSSELDGGDGLNITINGGTVTATAGGSNSAGIGGGCYASGSNITINGGSVTATGAIWGAGIGGGCSGSGSNITIKGGTVMATGGEWGAGIGGGEQGSGSNITINGGTVTATGGDYGAGIGSGKNGDAASNIFVADNIVLKADGNNPPTTVIAHASIETDVASLLANKRYATAETGVQELGVTVNDVDVGVGSGDGWTFADGLLSLTNAQSYVLAGANTAGAVRVEVTAAKASVTLDNLKLTGLETTNMLTFASAATLTLVGDNTVYATNDFAGVCILEGASVTLSGNGALVGGKAKSWCSRGVNVYGTLTMDGGTIRDYLGLDYAGGLYVGETGVMTMNGGSIANNEVHGYGGGIWNGGTTVINGGEIANNTAKFFGGAVLSDVGGTVTMNGGEVKGNKVVVSDPSFGGTAFGVYGTLVVNGGSIHDNNTETENKDCIVSRGTAFIYGGAFLETRYFRIGTKGTESTTGVINLYGCVSYSELKDFIVSGYKCVEVETEEGGYIYVVGKDVKINADYQLTGGTYTFCPTNAEYKDAGLVVASDYGVQVNESASVTTYTVAKFLDLGDDAKVYDLGGGTFLVNGNGELTKTQADVLKAQDVTSLVIGAGVTGIGEWAFSYWNELKDVTIGDDVTSLASNAFFRCAYITNLVIGANVAKVGATAFDRCRSLESISFGSLAAAEAAQETYKIVARITMDGTTPVVDSVPEVKIDGYTKTLKGKVHLTDSEWETVEMPLSETPYHFFKYEYVAE